MNLKHNNTRIYDKYLLKNHYSLKQLFHDICESVSGTEQDFTNGSLRRAILLLSIPMVLEMLMESVFAIVDIYFVSRLGAGAVATVGLTESIISIIYSIAIGFSTATAAVVSRRIGEKNPSGAGNAAFQAILLGISASLIIGIPGVVFAERLLIMMGSPHETARELSSYTAIMLGGNVVIMLLFIINAIFRSSGDAAVSMRVLWMANIINIILVPCLIFGLGPFPQMGIAGAAVATTTGRGVAVLYQFYLLFSGRKRIKLERHHLVIDLKVIGRLLKLSFGGMGQSIIMTSSWIALVRIIALFGPATVAGYTIGIRLVVFALLPSLGISNAASTLVGQNLGARKAERAEQSVWTTGWINLVLMGVIGLIFVIWPRFFIGLFIKDTDVIARGMECLRIISYGFMAYGLGMVLVSSFNGAGDTSTPMKINVFCYWLLEIPLAYLLAIPLKMKEQGVFYAILIAEIMMTVTAYFIFRRGKWKLKRV
jgi:putative MATE family efflux protein